MKKSIVKYKNYCWALFLLMLLVGCKDKFEMVDNEYRPSDIIVFMAALNNDVQAEVTRGVASYLSIEEEEWQLNMASQSEATRGALVSSLEGMNVGVYGYTTSDRAEVFDNAPFTFVDNEDLLPDRNPIAWKTIKDKSLKVFAYAPKMTLVDWKPADGNPKINYTVPTAVGEQKDIIASDSEVAKNYNQYIPLMFKHVLTGVRFKVGFDCVVKSLRVEGVYGEGVYELGNTWSGQKNATDFELIKEGTKSYSAGTMLTEGDNILMMIPQLLPEGAKVVFEYDGGKREVSLEGLKWEPGKLITYTINAEEEKPEYIYFDLNAGNVTITPTSYSGKIFVKGVATDVTANSVDVSTLKFYVYQSTEVNKINTGWETKLNVGTCRIPKYAPVMVGNKFWSEFITNNTSVESVIETWDNKAGTSGAVRSVGRTHTMNRIEVTCPKGTAITCDLTIDNLYSKYQEASVGRTTAGLLFRPLENNSILTVNLVGDNRFGAVHYTSKLSNNEIIFQGTGSLTVADVDFHTASSDQSKSNGEGVSGYFSNYWCSAIGGNDSGEGNAIGIVFKGGTIFAGTTLAENCTAIGGGGNDKGVVTIEGGTITAVAATTGVAIGGGIGFNSQGGIGLVNISGGTVYAYNLGNEWEIPSAAIGSAGSSAKYGGDGEVNISGNAYVYAQTALGTAIGGGSSKTQHGGNAKVNISGNCYVVAKSIEAVDKKTGNL